MRKKLVIAGSIVVALLVLLAFLSPLYPSPAPFTLAPLSNKIQASRRLDVRELQGRWKLAQGSFVGYRVWEKDFITPHLAVARTSNVQGSLTVTADSGGLQVSEVTVSVGLAGLQSIDSMAANPFASRDPLVSQLLDVQRYPTATFMLNHPIQLAPTVKQNQILALTVSGQLSIHGVTRAESVSLRADMISKGVQVIGVIQTSMVDFGVQPPRYPPFTVVAPGLTLEFELRYVKA